MTPTNFNFLPGSVVQSWVNTQTIQQFKQNFQFISELDNELDMTMSQLNIGMQQMEDAYQVLQVLALAVIVATAVSIICFIISLILLGKAKRLSLGSIYEDTPPKPKKPKKPRKRLKLSFVQVDPAQESSLPTTKPVTAQNSKAATEEELEQALKELREASRGFKYEPINLQSQDK